MIRRPTTILLVEDNPGDARLIREALKDSKLPNIVHHAKDGVEGLAFLQKDEPYADAPRPDLILLDLNMPRMNGLELLKRIKDDPFLRRIPVVVLTISKSEEDIISSYNLHANCFISKPVDLDQFSGILQAINDYWFDMVRLPPERS
jgi:CheY-like chemotaxis protein